MDDQGSYVFHHGTGIAFNMDAKLRGGAFGPTSTTKYEALNQGSEIAYWGTANLWPQDVLKEVNESDVLRPLIRNKAKRLIGQGILYGTTSVDERTGDIKRNAMNVLEIDRALKKTAAPLFLYEQLVDYLTHGIAFAELQTDFEGRVVGLYSQDAVRCRFTKKDKMGRINNVLLSGKWGQGATRPDDAIEVPALDPYYDPAGQVMRGNKGRYILPTRLLHDDNDYYGQAQWHGLILGGYLDLAKAIIKCKLYLTQNLSHIRYHVEVGSEFWENAFPGFKDKKPEAKKKVKEDFTEAFTKWATGVEKSGRTLMTEMLLDDIGMGKAREYRSLVRITPLKLDIPTGAYVEDSAEVDAKIIRAFMDASLFGATPSKDRNSSGSGSDKRIAHTLDLLDNQVEMDLLLTPFDIMAETNGWSDQYGNGKMLKFWTKSFHTATLDQKQGVVTSEPQPTAPPKA